MIYILLEYSRDFASMIAFQKDLIRSHEVETERERALAEVRFNTQREHLRHAERFEAAISNMSQGLCMFDADDRLIVCNDYLQKMYESAERID